MIPHGVTRLDGDDATLHIVHIVLVLLECHGYDSDIDFFVDTLGFKTILQEIARGMCDVVGHLDGLGDGFDSCALTTFFAVSRWRMISPKIQKKRKRMARQKNTMPMASSVMPKPWGSSRFR